MSILDCLASLPAIKTVHSLLTNPRYFWNFAFLIIIADALLSQLIIQTVPYTEIDWETYMAHIDVFLKGQHNYTMITGPTGPLVYPAGHVRIHQWLHNITDGGRNIAFAQQIYGNLYTVLLILTFAIYRKAGGLPNWVLLLLPLSKRMHSIFLLRLFNDCWAVVLAQAAILLYQSGADYTATFLYSAALSVKMSVLLYLPGLLVILFRRQGLLSTFRLLGTIFATQVVVAVPFLREDMAAYVNSAFDLRRAFLYEWTVNWRFLDEGTFLSRVFSIGLLLAHVAVLVLFGFSRWCAADGGVWAVIRRGVWRPQLPAGRTPITADDVAMVLFSSNLIGIIFARSLHYQFYSWYAYQVPFLAWRTPYPLPVKIALIFGVEYAWNVYPSTSFSSSVLLCANTLLLLGVWVGNGENASGPRTKG